MLQWILRSVESIVLKPHDRSVPFVYTKIIAVPFLHDRPPMPILRYEIKSDFSTATAKIGHGVTPFVTQPIRNFVDGFDLRLRGLLVSHDRKTSVIVTVAIGPGKRQSIVLSRIEIVKIAPRFNLQAGVRIRTLVNYGVPSLCIPFFDCVQ